MKVHVVNESNEKVMKVMKVMKGRQHQQPAMGLPSLRQQLVVVCSVKVILTLRQQPVVVLVLLLRVVLDLQSEVHCSSDEDGYY